MPQEFKKLKVYQEAFGLSKGAYLKLQNANCSLRLREQLFGAVSSICANLAEMGAFENKAQQKQKIITCISEANEAEYWFDLCKELGIISANEHADFLQKLVGIRRMLFRLLEAVKQDS